MTRMQQNKIEQMEAAAKIRGYEFSYDEGEGGFVGFVFDHLCGRVGKRGKIYIEPIVLTEASNETDS